MADAGRRVKNRPRAVAACLALSLLGLGFLFLHAKSITPRSMSIGDVGGEDAGAPVRLRGHVHRVGTTDEGNAAIVLMDYEDFATIRVIARPRAIAEPALVAPGALVEVTGTVFEAGGSLQVFCEDLGSVALVSPPSTNLLPLEFVARNAARLGGQRVVVRGAVADVYAVVDPRHALLRENGSSLWAFSDAGWEAGRADVVGRLLVTSRGRCELFAGEEAHAIPATVAALATCPEVLLDQPVLVRNATVEPGELLGTALTMQDQGDGAEFRMAAFVRGWDWRGEDRPVRLGDILSLEGTVEYQATEARWRIAASEPPTP